ncbi:zinc finger protein 160 isoform X1 [Microplitis demolitor]|uniref:zinc finger protein 160 isoform X1 n=1 Tax=Microplitis demolitor TaxID=69319 RepID=UPI0004CCC261|nr:zinc finger protein 160 isoform X1 [Microplitis demolitor]
MDAVDIEDNNQVSHNDDDNVDGNVEICRVCLLSNHLMRDLFGENDVVSLSTKAMSFANVKIHPDDGLPTQVCCECADKLESAYEFKLQVEQADSLLREKYDSLNIKEELFFNEVEVRLENERHDDVTDMVDEHYEVTGSVSDDKTSLLKDHLALLQVEKLTHHQEQYLEDEVMKDQIMQSDEQYIEDEHTDEQMITEAIESSANDNIKPESIMHDQDGIAVEEHNYIVQHQDYTLSNEQDHELINTDNVNEHDASEYLSIIGDEERLIKETESHLENVIDDEKNNCYINDNDEVNDDDDDDNNKLNTIDEIEMSKNECNNASTCHNDIDPTDQGSDDENYFENLNLSSRLSQTQSVNKPDNKIFFMCYICDQEFLSKDILKEHMNSHDEVKQTLSMKKTPDKATQKNISPIKSQPPSGKKPNKCPYCGKEYLYVISFKKHIKQHQKNDDELKENMDSLLQNDNSADSNNYDNTDTFEVIADDKHNIEEYTDNGNDNRSINVDIDHQNLSKHGNNCPDIFSDNCNEASAHQDYQDDKQKCNICELEFDSMDKLKNHRSTHVIEGVITEQDLKDELASICQREYDQEKIIDGNLQLEVKKEYNELKCPTCFLLFGSKKSLAKHLETHESIRYRCKICGDEFTQKDDLRKHAEQHSQVKTFKCMQCNKIFANELTLRNHLIATNHKTTVHGEEYDPNKRIKRVAARAAQKIIDKISTEDSLDDSERDDDDDDYDELILKSESGVSGKTGEKSVSKKLFGKSKNLECETCGKRCISKQALAKHMDYHMRNMKAESPESKNKKNNEVKDITRSVPGFSDINDDDDDDDDDNDFDGGLDWPMDNHECSTCKKRYSTKKSLLRHQLLHEEPNFECDICNVKFYRKDKLKAHYDKCSEKNPNQVRKCNICGDTFENNDILREHRSKHVDEGILTEEDLKDLEPGSEDRKGEKIARKRRTDIVGLECTECNKQYTSRKGLLRHIQVHEGKKYLCDICPKKFYRREHLKIHVAKHNMIKPHKCPRCSKRFMKEEQLSAHLTKHERTFKKNKEPDSTSKRFLCEICSKSFTQSTTLVAHLRAHNGIKPYVCEVCARPFTTNAYLKMHMRTHTQERPYTCQFCARAFARADTLANHLTSHTGEAKYHCKYCPKNFRRLKSLKEHVFIHTGQRPYACPTCDRRFNNNGSRYAHSKRCKQNMLQNQARQNQPQTSQPQITQPQITQPQISQPQISQPQISQPQINQPQINQQTIAIASAPQTATIRLAHSVGPTMQVVQSKNVKTITITRPETVGTHQILQHQELLMPLILPLTVTLTDCDDEVILPEGTKIFTTT